MSDAPQHSPKRGLAKLSHEGSSGAEQRHVVSDMARVVESAIQNLEQRAEQEKAQQQTDPSAASAEAEAKAAESTAVHSAAGQPLTESALHDALGIPPPRQMQPHVRDPISAGKMMPSTYQSVARNAHPTESQAIQNAGRGRTTISNAHGMPLNQPGGIHSQPRWHTKG